MSTDILARIQAQLHTFSKGQKRIANYILESYDKAAFMTASKLGKTVAVSESTVVRFAVELGFDGYPSMQRSLQEMVRTRLTSVQRIEAANDRLRRSGRGVQRAAKRHRLHPASPPNRSTGGRWPPVWRPFCRPNTSILLACARPPRWPPTSTSTSAIFLTTSARQLDGDER